MKKPFMKRSLAARARMKAVLQTAMEQGQTLEVDLSPGQPRSGQVTRVDDLEFVLTVSGHSEYHGLIREIVGVLVHTKKPVS